MKKLLLGLLASAALLSAARADGPVIVLQLNATGTNAGNLGQTSLTLAAGQYASVDGSGNPLAVTPAVYAPLPRTGTLTLTVAGGLTKTVTFVNPMPSANYSIALSTSGVTAAVVSWTNKTATGFTLNLSATTVGSVDYTCTPQTSATQ